MDIFNADDQRTILDMLRRADFSDAEKTFVAILDAARSQGRVDGAHEMGAHLLAKIDNPATQLEGEIRRTVLAKFRPRETPEGGAA